MDQPYIIDIMDSVGADVVKDVDEFASALVDTAPNGYVETVDVLDEKWHQGCKILVVVTAGGITNFSKSRQLLISNWIH